MKITSVARRISVEDAEQFGVDHLVDEVEQGREWIIVRDGEPVAAVVDLARLDDLERTREDLLDLSLAAARMLTTGPERHSLDTVLTEFGYTREELRALPE